MNKSQFIKSLGALCNNLRFAWSYINEAKQFILFGAWTQREVGSSQLGHVELHRELMMVAAR